MQIVHPTTLNDHDYVVKKGHQDATISSYPNRSDVLKFIAVFLFANEFFNGNSHLGHDHR